MFALTDRKPPGHTPGGLLSLSGCVDQRRSSHVRPHCLASLNTSVEAQVRWVIEEYPCRFPVAVAVARRLCPALIYPSDNGSNVCSGSRARMAAGSLGGVSAFVTDRISGGPEEPQSGATQ